MGTATQARGSSMRSSGISAIKSWKREFPHNTGVQRNDKVVEGAEVMKNTSVLGVPLSMVKRQELLREIEDTIRRGRQMAVVAVNARKIVRDDSTILR